MLRNTVLPGAEGRVQDFDFGKSVGGLAVFGKALQQKEDLQCP